MGGSSSKYEVAMPQLPVMEPTGVVKACMTRTKPIRLEFGKKPFGGGVLEIRDADTGQIVFEAEKELWGKNQLRYPRGEGVTRDRAVLDIHTRTLGWKWDVKGDSMTGNDKVHSKPHLFIIDCHTGRKPSFTVEFTYHGNNVKWLVQEDKQHLSIIVTTQDQTLIAHAGYHERQTFPKSTGFVLTVAPGIDYAMIVAVFLCRTQYLEHRKKAARSAAAAGGASAGGASGC